MISKLLFGAAFIGLGLIILQNAITTKDDSTVSQDVNKDDSGFAEGLKEEKGLKEETELKEKHSLSEQVDFEDMEIFEFIETDDDWEHIPNQEVELETTIGCIDWQEDKTVLGSECDENIKSTEKIIDPSEYFPRLTRSKARLLDEALLEMDAHGNPVLQGTNEC